jgi:predicted methyltransferase
MTIAFAVIALAGTGCAATSTRMQTAAELDRVLASPHRPAGDVARDVYRHPKETLLFFGLRPEMTVLELSPGGGWYTRVIAPVVRESGQFLAGLAPLVATNANSVRSHENFRNLMNSAPGMLDRVQIVPFDPGRTPIAPPGSVDLVLTFRSLHGWMARDQAAAVIADMFRVLKPGGVLGIVEHRGPAQVPQDPKAGNGYVNQDYTVRLFETAGFRLVATSEINANPKDTKDHPRGVWTLPPVLAEGDKDRAKYLAIGESDRYTLKFVKPR